ncbi:MAG: FAD-dependent tricarballylate dehydrogenase TcuA [Gammaproteobacteria bacterium]|nr:FAD-dependent tricarballylate dehydrogenase TcuA [Gammaproteobacteria bacterium]MYF59048.1 FAD-dependent tricarballylate dehydrogenase TcuA [Gammaproteobacteria bacterium]
MSLPRQTDVLVIGGGNAGLCAAIEARERGAAVVILEHADRSMRGGNTRHTRNLRAMHAGPAHTLERSYTGEEYWQDLLSVTEGHTDEALARLMIRHSGELLGWLHEKGVRFQPALTGTLNLARTNAFFLGGGKALLNAQYRTAEALGVRVCYDSEVKRLNISRGHFGNAVFLYQGEEHEIAARSVVVACGGFQANENWMREAWGEAADNFIVRGTSYNRGTVLKDLIGKGAETTGDPTQCHAIAVDARAPKYDGGIVTRLDCVVFGIVVNRFGQRFYDEGEDSWPKRYAIWGRLIARQPDQIAYAIMDSKVLDRFMPSLFPPMTADTIEQLASDLGIESGALTRTVDQFNASVSSGSYNPEILDDCSTHDLQPPKSHWALPLDTPPFYAYPLRPGITFTYLGVKVDEQARVLFQGGKSSPNVFAAGEIMAGNIIGKGYCAGTGMTIGAVFGRLAGQHAASAV